MTEPTSAPPAAGHNRKLIGRSFIHSCYVPNTATGGDAVTVSEHLHYNDDTVEPHLRVINDPPRVFHTTKKPYRQLHTEKKERERVEHCDRHVAPNKTFLLKAHEALFGYKPRFLNYKAKQDVLNSPYLYGAGSDIQSLVKIRYRKDFDKTGLKLAPVTTGMYDTEISIVEGSTGDLICYTLTHENKVYTAINENWLHRYVDGIHQKISLDEVKALSQKTLIPMIEEAFSNNKNLKKLRAKLPFEFHYLVSGDPVEMIKWGFDHAHQNETSFIGGWNIKYDIGETARILRERGIEPKDIFSHPSIPEGTRFFDLREDKKKVAHYADKWHWFSTTSLFQFLDLMAIYNRLRVVNGKESSYALDYILAKNGLGGKLHFRHLGDLEKLEGTADWHRRMSTQHPLEYVIYNQWDSISLQLLEWQNTDTTALRILSDNTSLDKYPRQTVKNQDTLHAEWIDKGWVMGTAGSEMVDQYDEELEAEGGAVLDSYRVDKTGVRLIREFPTLVSQIHVFVSDADFSQMYPTVMENANISNETRVTTMYAITGDHLKVSAEEAVETLYSCLISPKDNAHYFGTTFLNFPTFAEIDDDYCRETGRLVDVVA